MNTQAAELRNAPLSAAAHPTRSTLVTLVRRELWEHPGLWRVPAVVAALLALSTLIAAGIGVDLHGVRVPVLDEQTRITVLNMSQLMFALIIYVVAAFVVSFYALDCLYAERKDRSILFWKSLPVSDGMTVLSKFLVAVVVVPLLAIGLAIVGQLIALLIWQVRVSIGNAPDVVSLSPLAWLRGVSVIFLIALLSSLWYAPLIGASMLLSVGLKKSPLLWAFLGPLLLVIFEYIVFRTRLVWSVLRYRSDGIWQVLAPHGAQANARGLHLLRELNWAGAFTSPNLWLGVLAAAALLYGAARIRRYRDDT